MDGKIINNHLEQNKYLMPCLCRNETEPIKNLCDVFNAETDNGRDMKKYNSLLGMAIESIINVKSDSDTDAWLQGYDVIL